MMPKESRSNASRGEVVSLREYVDTQVEFCKNLIELAREESKSALSTADKAINKAEAATERRLAGMNEFRDALSDYSRTLTPRPEFEQALRDLKEKFDSMTERASSRDLMPRNESERMHMDSKERIEALNERLTAVEARSHGRNDIWGWVVGAIGVLVAVITIMNKLFGTG